HHPDQHSIAFYPNNPNAMITGHDGGLSKTTNDLEQPQTWTLLNNGYLTSQFYAIATDPKPGNVFLVGGMQDNGSWGTDSNNFQDDWFNLIGGDGGFAAIAPGGLPFYASSQNGNIVRVTQSNNQLVGSLVTPAGAQNFLFVTPYLLDPNDARVMYLAAGNQVWRNSNLDSIPEGNQDPTDINWAALDSSAAPANMQVTALAVTRFPADRLYFAATDFENNTIVKRVDNAPSNPTGTDITPPGIAAGSAVSSIAVNPNNGDEILVTISNYNVPRVWHSTDGGTNWSNVEGNLGGENGPSVRWGVIAPGVGYFLATSVGIFSTQNLNGANTVWVQEGNSVIGNVVVNMLVHRPEDGLIVAATHGRGAYSAQLAGGGLAMIEVNVQNLTIEAKPDETGSTQFTLSNAGTAPLTYNITATGQFTSSTENAHLHVLHWDGQSHKSINVVDAFLANKKYNSPARLQKTLTVAGDSSGKNSRVQQNDVLFLDDGDDMPDIFIGFNDGTDFLWMNRFILADQDFQLEAMDFYMRTENANSNPIYAAALDQDFNVIVDGNLDLGLSPNGDWFTLTFDPPIQFSAGDTFGLAIGASGVIGFPAGADQDATVPDNSFFLDPSTGNFINLNTQPNFAQGAFLVRAVGTLSGTKPPAERLTVSPASGSIAPGNSQNITVTLDATGLAEGTYQGEVKISSNGGNLTLPLQMIVSQTVDVEDVASLPETFTLQQNFPNPFNPETTIRYSLPAHARVSLVIYDLRGRRVALLESNENKQAGEYRVIWNGKDNQGKTLPSGIYIYQLKAELSNGQTIRASRKMTLLK
ncbi:MAG: T9SS C-terminal target domain-containing protein, partial [Calditrichaeota bacterium]